jgi:protein-tyrosine-phosphatase
MDWDGVAMVEFRHDRDSGSAVLMEVNRRYWGALPLAIHAGLDFPMYEWQLAQGEPVRAPSSYPAQLRCRWLIGDLRRLHAVVTNPRDDEFPRRTKRAEIFTFVRDCFLPSHSAIWSWSDPAASRHELRSALGAVWKRLKLPLKRRLSRYRYLGFRVSLVLLRLRFRAALGSPHLSTPFEMAAIRSVIFVCEGNIMRSPMAHALLRDYLDLAGVTSNISVSSAGFAALANRPADDRAIRLASKFGVSLDGHSTQPLTAQQIGQADMVVIMDRINEAKMLVLYPEAMKKTFFLGAFQDAPLAPADIEIADPYEGSIEQVHECFCKIESHVRCLARTVAAQRNSAAVPARLWS